MTKSRKDKQKTVQILTPEKSPQTCECGATFPDRPSLVAHLVTVHLADNSGELFKLEMLHPPLIHLAKRPSTWFSYESSVPIHLDGQTSSALMGRLTYQLLPAKGKKPAQEFEDIFQFVDHLYFTENIKDYEQLKERVRESRIIKECENLKIQRPQKQPMLTAPPALPELPEGFSEESKTDLEQTMLEMANYAFRCLADNYPYIDELNNFDVGDLLPGDNFLEPSTDHTSSKKKEKQLKADHNPTGVNLNKEFAKSGEEDFSNLQLVKNEQENTRNSENFEVRRRLMKTAGPSPDRAKKLSLNPGEESIPLPRDFDKFLAKRKPEIAMPQVMPIEIHKMSNKKPTYVSRNASPPRAVKKVVIDESHPLYRKIDMAKEANEQNQKNLLKAAVKTKLEEKRHQKEPEVTKEEDSIAHKSFAKVEDHQNGSGGLEQSPTINKKSQHNGKPAGISQPIQMPGKQMIPIAPKVKESCEQRVELTHWPAQIDSRPLKPVVVDKQSSNKENGFSKIQIEKYISLGFLRNMSGPPTRAGEKITK